MEAKHKVGGLCNMVYILYIIFLIQPIQSLINSGIISTDIKLFQIIYNIDIGDKIWYFIFQIMFLFFIFVAISTESKNISECEDKGKIKILNKELYPYKIFIALNITGTIILLVLTKDKELFLSSILLIATSILLHFSKEMYLKACLFDRKRIWLEKITNENYDEKDIDTKNWRHKFWFDNKVKITIQDRASNITMNIVAILMCVLFFINFGLILTTFVVGDFFIKNIIKLLENVFSLFTTIDGVCTGVYEDRKKNSVFYRVVVTDYKNKKEICLKLNETYCIDSMDNISVVHGVFSKQCISINNIKQNESNAGNFVIFLIPLLLFGGFNIKNEPVEPIQHEQYQDATIIEHKGEPIPLDKLGKYKVIDISSEKNYKGVDIELDKLYLGKKGSKLLFSVINNSDKGMVLNLDYNTFIRSDQGQNSNILLPGVKYDLEMDILQKYNKKSAKELVVNLEYTLSETILFEYLDYTNNNFYPLNVVDSNCEIVVDLVKEDFKINFSDYDQFYKKQEDIVKFQ